MTTTKRGSAVRTGAAAASPPKKPIQEPLFDASTEPRVRADQWRFDDPPASIGTLPREVYQALCVLRAARPCTAQVLGKAIVRYYDWDLSRITRVVTRLASCGYVSMGDGGILSERLAP